ncbi:MAG: tudor domain-containing protein [Chloroherpetonaceae bacterium]|nr:tudor domain-containing protein [Chloroherpetonaceae bacterium]
MPIQIKSSQIFSLRKFFYLIVLLIPSTSFLFAQEKGSSSGLENTEWKVGNPVMARWLTEPFFYPAVIDEIADGKVHVKYLDGDIAWVTYKDLMPLRVDIGTRVNARWQNGKVYYWGKIAKINNDGQIYIEYDDGDKEWTTIKVIRIQP